MKILHVIAASLLGAAGALTTAQTTQDPATSPAVTGTAAMPSATMGTVPAAPRMAEETVFIDLTDEPGPPADPQAAREEAVNALHWARTEGCREVASPRDCLRQAQEDYRTAMEGVQGRR